jgi:DNA-binding SARP family transcriptional activator/predicted negative regulator of RcsB-dependent stress response
MQVRLFGGLAVAVDGGPVALGSPKQRLVLAALAVEANHVMSVERLIDVVWGERAPNDPASSLQAYVSNLRRALEPDRDAPPQVLVTQAPGYRLVVGPADLDVARVDRLVADGLAAQRDGDHSAAIGLLEAALQQSEAAPVPELADRPIGVALHARWVAQRGAAIEALVDAQLALGRHAEVAATVPRRIEQHPHREHLRAQLALALYRDGRQVEALRSIDDTRRRLADDVGVSLSPELQTLEARILGHDPGLDLARPATSPSARDAMPRDAIPRGVSTVPSAAQRPATALYGRARELDALLGSLDAAFDGRGSSVVVSGEPGIGKSRLVQELVDAAVSRGFAIGWGRCPESGAAPSFFAANQIAAQLLESGVIDAGEFGLLPNNVGEDVRPSDEMERAGDAHRAGAQRFALQLTVAKALRAAYRPMLLVVDDVQWADAATLALVEFVASELSALRVLVVVIARPTGLESAQTLVECLGELARQRDSLHLRLAGLDSDAATAWMHALPGDAVPRRVIELVHDRSGGNPFYLEELVALLESEGRLRDPRLHRASNNWVPATVQDVIRRRVSRLPADVQKVLSVASVVGRTFDADVLGAVAEVEQIQLFDLLDVAGQSGLVGAADAPGRFSFSHALVAEALIAELSAPRLAAVHARVVDAIERLRADALEAHVAELAHHAYAAIAVGLARQAYDYSVRAARLATSSVAHEDAVVHWTRALQSLDAMRARDDAARADTARYDVLVGLGAAQLILDDVVAASKNLQQAARIAQRAGDHVAAARSMARLNHASLWEPNNYQDRDESVAELFEEVLANLPDVEHELRALVLGALATEIHHVDREGRVALTDEAIELARRVGDPHTLVRVLSNRNYAHHCPEGLAMRREVARELREVLAQHEVTDELWALGWYVIACTEREGGAAREARTLLARADEAAERSGSMTLLAQIRFSRATAEVSAGNLERSAQLAAAANEIYRRGRGFSADTIQAATTLHTTMELAGAAVVAEFMAAASGEAYAAQWLRLLAWTYVEAGNVDAARATLAAATAAGPPTRDWTWLMTMVFTGVVQAAVDDRAGAAESYVELLPYAGRLAWTGTNSPVFDAVDTCLAVLAACISEHHAARRHFDDAIALNEQAGARMWHARALVLQGEWLLGQGEPEAAQASFEQARVVGDSYGSVQVAALVERAAARLPTR